MASALGTAAPETAISKLLAFVDLPVADDFATRRNGVPAIEVGGRRHDRTDLEAVLHPLDDTANVHVLPPVGGTSTT
jgi:hypothetical protein